MMIIFNTYGCGHGAPSSFVVRTALKLAMWRPASGDCKLSDLFRNVMLRGFFLIYMSFLFSCLTMLSFFLICFCSQVPPLPHSMEVGFTTLSFFLIFPSKAFSTSFWASGPRGCRLAPTANLKPVWVFPPSRKGGV